MMDDQELLTLEEVRSELREAVSIQTLRRKIKCRQLRAIKLGRRFLIRRQWLNQLIDGDSRWEEDENTNTNSATSGLVNGLEAPRGTSCGAINERAVLSDYQQAQAILSRPNGS